MSAAPRRVLSFDGSDLESAVVEATATWLLRATVAEQVDAPELVARALRVVRRVGLRYLELCRDVTAELKNEGGPST